MCAYVFGLVCHRGSLVLVTATLTSTLWSTSLLSHDDLINPQNCQHRVYAKAESPSFRVLVVEDSCLYGIADELARLDIDTRSLLSFRVCCIQLRQNVDITVAGVLSQDFRHHLKRFCDFRTAY